ncbi:hypothetical protein M3Y95_00435400 [Aphelenchoides besseyi]|nr:hypothetical protein M3Y95_00435400 [Aphelenchoides besseyi]
MKAPSQVAMDSIILDSTMRPILNWVDKVITDEEEPTDGALWSFDHSFRVQTLTAFMHMSLIQK